MSLIFSTNVFVRGYMAYYDVSTSNPDIYHLNLKICRLQINPPPKFLRMQKRDNHWESLDPISDEFTFIIEEIGNRIFKGDFRQAKVAVQA